MIVKMKFLSITGPKHDIDRAIDRYISKYEIQLENASTEFKTVRHVRSYVEPFRYKEELNKSTEYLQTLGISPSLDSFTEVADASRAVSIIHDVDQSFANLKQKKIELEEQIKHLDDYIDHIKNYTALDFDVNEIFKFKYIKYRFGRFSRDYYEKYINYIDEDLDAIFFKCNANKDYVWGVYFVPSLKADKIDAVFASLHFERMHLDDDVYSGTPQQALKSLMQQKEELVSIQRKLEQEQEQLLTHRKNDILYAYQAFTKCNLYSEAKKYAAYIKKDEHEQFLLCGWMTEEDALKLSEEIKPDPDFFCLFEEDHEKLNSNPPTKLINPKLFRPFEMFTRMYGLPNYKEFDPTVLLAITYSFIFGVMFGDVGQGLVLFIGGALLYRFKHLTIAACISCCGIFSTIFGFMFGSIFGYEEIIKPIWLRPMKQMSNLPFVGQLNTIFIITISFGMFMIVVSIILQIMNALRMRNTESTFFDANGIAGLIFYGSVVGTIVLFMTGHKVSGGILAILLFVLPLLCIAFKEPLTKIVEKKPKAKTTGIGMFIITTFFELFEVLLSYFSNTLSFVRIGAFAVSHAAMMEVVLMLAGATDGGTGNILTIIIGNLIVCAMEGLVVGIQVLRLEYYEMFSRYYHGDGIEFKPFMKLKDTNQ